MPVSQMTVNSKHKPAAGAGSLDAASSGSQGCVGSGRSPGRGPTRSRPRGEFCERRRKKTEARRSRKKREYIFRTGSMNVGTMRGRSSEVVETADRRRVDLVLLQETKWKGAESPAESRTQVRWIKGRDSAYKFFWSGNLDGSNGVGILLAKKWTDHVFEVQRPSDRIILLKLIIGKTVYVFLSVYAPQKSGYTDAVKDQFYDQLTSVLAKIPPSEVLIPGGDWNGHVGSTADGYEGVHGGFGYGERNKEGERILEFALAHDLIIGNTLFMKKDDHLITFASNPNKTQIDYFLFRRRLRGLLKDVKVIPGEECLTQHRLLLCSFKVSTVPKPKRKFTPRLKTWKLRDPAYAAKFEAAFSRKCGAEAVDSKVQSCEEIWSRLKSGLNSAAVEVCGYSKSHQWKKQTWWWDSSVDQAISVKRKLYKAYNKLKKQKKTAEAEVAKGAYNEAKRHAKKVVWAAKAEAEKTVFADIDPNGADVYRIAKQMRRDNQDVSGEMPVRNNLGELSLDDSARMKAWVEHYDGLLNVEFPWDESSLPDAPPVFGPPPPITDAMIIKALNKMKSGKAAGPSGIVVEMLKSAGQKGIDFLRELTISVVVNGKIPEDWELSFILNLYKGKGDALDRGNYRGLKLTEHVLKVLERIVDTVIREIVDIDGMQFAFVPERGTTDAIFILRQLQERFLSSKDSQGKNKPLYFAFVDLEKAFDRIPRKVLWWAMRSLGVDEWVVRLVQGMYNNARSKVRVGNSYSEEFGVGVGVHQGSVLSPLLFIIVLEALSREFREGLPWELFFADDLVIVADSLEKCVARVKAWKKGMESKGLRVNMKKTMIMVSGPMLDILKDSGEFPCAVCRKGVGKCSAIQCTVCLLWVHNRCKENKRVRKDKKRVRKDDDYACRRCMGDESVRPIDGRPFVKLLVGDEELDVVDNFCYLGDTISAGGGCESAAIARCRSAWAKFRQLLPVLTARSLPLKTKGRIYNSCVRGAMLHACETWPMKAPDLYRMCRNDRAMVRWILKVKTTDGISSAEMYSRLGLLDLSVVIRQRRLRWFGHVKRSSGAINWVRTMNLPGCGPPSRGGWYGCAIKDLRHCGLSEDMAHDRKAWRTAVKSCRLEPTPRVGSVQPLTRGRRTRSSIK